MINQPPRHQMYHLAFPLQDTEYAEKPGAEQFFALPLGKSRMDDDIG